MAKTVLILGAYGFIGRHIYRHLNERIAFQLIALGRDPKKAKHSLPDANWHFEDISRLVNADDWAKFLNGVDVVINAAGALQDNPNDDLDRLHFYAIKALAQACTARDVYLVQISAMGARIDADTNFLRSKAKGDDAIRAQNGRYAIFRPGFVFAEDCYGGSEFLRAAASFPLIQPIAFGDTPMQCTAIHDINTAISRAIAGKYGDRYCANLAEETATLMTDMILGLRNWMGIAPPRRIVRVPNFLATGLAKLGDMAASLGWKPAMRTTSIRVLRQGVTGTIPNDLGFRPQSFDASLASMAAPPSAALLARLYWLFPLTLITLSLFWILSGVIGIVRINDAITNLAVWPTSLAMLSVAFWAVADIGLGLAVLRRKWAKRAFWGMALVSTLYIIFALLFAPALLIDPLGPVLKIFPVIIASIFGAFYMDSR